MRQPASQILPLCFLRRTLASARPMRRMAASWKYSCPSRKPLSAKKIGTAKNGYIAYSTKAKIFAPISTPRKLTVSRRPSQKLARGTLGRVG